MAMCYQRRYQLLLLALFFEIMKEALLLTMFFNCFWWRNFRLDNVLCQILLKISALCQ